jgi:hypothetical protein
MVLFCDEGIVDGVDAWSGMRLGESTDADVASGPSRCDARALRALAAGSRCCECRKMSPAVRHLPPAL